LASIPKPFSTVEGCFGRLYYPSKSNGSKRERICEKDHLNPDGKLLKSRMGKTSGDIIYT
jgi:hypothetical protein